MAENTASEVYDLLILVDATYSMLNYLESLKTSLPKVISISKLTDSFSHIGLLAYRDYTEANRDQDGMLEWSGWYDHQTGTNDRQDKPHASTSINADALMALASQLEPIGGGDYPEATKTGLAKAYELMRPDVTTIILLYTDAPPHCWMVADKDSGSNYFREQAALEKTNSYGGFGPYFADWVSAAKQLNTGRRKAHVFSFLDQSLQGHVLNSGYYTYLSTVTRGACLYLTDSKPHSIAQVTIDVLLAWMGAEKAGAERGTMPAKLVRYKYGGDIKNLKDEKDVVANSYFWAQKGDLGRAQMMLPTKAVEAQAEARDRKRIEENIAEVDVDASVLKKYLPKKRTLLGDFAQRYARDEKYRKVVMKELKIIIETDVTSMSLNPVFGALWRAACNDRNNPAREELVTAFSLHVERIGNAEEKTRMKNWLEESYDYAADILHALEQVQESERFPCVYLDPTIEFSQARKKGEKDEEEDEEDNRPVTAFRRDELLEIGRSCDGRILRRLGKVLTRVTFAQSRADLPAHIAATTNAEVPKIPLALASQQYNWKFWKMLLHVVLPGTMLSARPSVVLAALAIRIGLKPLFTSACAAMMFWRDKWNNVEVPETWNSSCLGLLLDADAEYRNQMQDSGKSVSEGLLLDSDRELFSRLVAYQHAGANLLTTLTAEVSWTPQKAQMPVGFVIPCRACGFPRSVTIMSANGRCGLCEATDWTDVEHKKRAISAQVSKEDTAASSATWVECSTRTCRAQYVCYNPGDLRVRAKCHYCRTQSKLPGEQKNNDPAPTLECKKCLSKIIWPKGWQAEAPKPFNCTACTSGMKTIVSTDTNASEICKENGQAWLLQDKNGVLKDPFKRSVFHTISTVGPEAFVANVQILPRLDPAPVLTLRGKRIQNQTSVIANLSSWIQRRKSEKSDCSLCFSAFPNARLLSACRRRGCHQKICEGCLNGWYGLNAPGTIINTAALFCPFCRRPPAPHTLAAYGKGIHAVGDLMTAIQEKGNWIHAWCMDCGKACRYIERQCARGAPDPVTQWKCETCSHLQLERIRIAEEEARQALELAALLDIEEREAAERKAREDLEAARKERTQHEVPVKECPHCHIPTQKTVGCDHMTCICNTHWCWTCGKEESRSTIYDHISKVHKGYSVPGLGWEFEDNDEGGW
ncbi:hypothetical protein CC80DRAFT_403555 [Byssothecium circinans]|uniref:RING-type domain-containing protein n=1 Tax=Byssothecium circinans TaxID=147558 RepID=A0A6A5UI19_9PLEO|nr:hypothetical protein CC80DRAFT_403555 [Byssothecium circinans]